MCEEIIEIFGAKYKIVADDMCYDPCNSCDLVSLCNDVKSAYKYPCEKEDDSTNRHFEKI